MSCEATFRLARWLVPVVYARVHPSDLPAAVSSEGLDVQSSGDGQPKRAFGKGGLGFPIRLMKDCLGLFLILALLEAPPQP